MVKCEVPNCDQDVGFMGRRLSQHVADMDLFFPMLDRLRNQANDVDRMAFEKFIETGESMRFVMHQAALGDKRVRSLLPGPGEINGWREAATTATAALMSVDPEWYANYWQGVLDAGIKIPVGLRTMLRRVGCPVR